MTSTTSNANRGASDRPPAEILHTLNAIGHEISVIAHRDDLLDLVLRRSLEPFRARSGSIFLVDHRSGELVLAAARGKHARDLLGVRQKLGHGIAGRAAKDREPVLVVDIHTDERFRSHQKKDGRYSSDSFLCVPLVSYDRVVGVLSIAEKETGEAFTPHDLNLLQVIAHQAASAILAADATEELHNQSEALHSQAAAVTRDLRLANHQLTELKEFHRSVIDGIPHGLVAFDRFYKVLFTNPAAQRLLELPSDLTVAPPVCDWTTDDGPDVWRELLSEVIRKGTPAERERVEFVLPSGKHLVARVHAAPLSGDNRIYGGLLVVDDLSSRLRIEERLRTAERLAVLGRLAAKVAHELNTPLDATRRFINLAQRSNVGQNEQRDGYLKTALTGLDRMADIISSLLRFARSARQQFGQVQINSLLREALSATDHLRAEKDIRLDVHMDESLPATNYANLTSVFANLIKNAYDAMGPGGTLEVTTGRSDESLFVRFRDTGCGIPKAFLPRIFEPFFTTKEVGKGTGLGLAICRDIVESYNGQITVESHEGEGSTFTVYLPMPGDLPGIAAQPVSIPEMSTKSQG